MERVFFESDELREAFFLEVRKITNESSWNALALKLDIPRSTFQKYQYGKSTIPKKVFNHLCSFLPIKRKQYFQQNTGIISNTWGQRKGGRITARDHPEIFSQGREIAWNTKQEKAPVYLVNKNQALSEELCELIGALIGDGYISLHGYKFELTGDYKLDKQYYHTRMLPICKKCFDITPAITRYRTCIRLRIYSKQLCELLNKRFQIPYGTKSHIIQIPTEIMNANTRFKQAVLRGMFDTDGGVMFDKRESYNVPYVRIAYTSVSKLLIQQTSELLHQLGVSHGITKRKVSPCWRIQINGVQNVKMFLLKIGFSNSRHTNKVDYLL